MVGSKRLAWGLLGTARINQAVIGPIQASKKSQLVAIASRTGDKAKEFAQKWAIPRHFGSYDELLADPTIDVIYNSLPNSLHMEWSIKAMQRGKHVLCEKPLTIHASDVDKLKEVSHNTGRVISEAFMYRHHPQTQKIKQMIDEGDIGKLQLIRGSFCYTITRPDNPRLILELGGGSLWDVGCYPVGYARYLTGEEPIEVYGQQVTGPTGIDLLFAGQLKFPSGIISQFECSFITPSKSVMEITGEKGRIIIPSPYKPGEKTEIFLEQGGKTKTVELRGADLYYGEIQDLEDAVLDGESPLISLDDSRRNITTIEALYQSAQTSISVTIQNTNHTYQERR
jgi:xylose dehydrogenase (NAD/NADP)